MLHVFFGFCIGSVPVDDAGAVLELVAQKHVLANGKQWDQRQLLVNDHDVFSFGILEGFKLAQLAVVIDFPGVGAVGINAGEYVHQGAFPGAVFTDKSMDLAAFHHQIHVVKRFDTREFFGDVFHFQDDVSQARFLL